MSPPSTAPPPELRRHFAKFWSGVLDALLQIAANELSCAASCQRVENLDLSGHLKVRQVPPLALFKRIRRDRRRRPQDDEGNGTLPELVIVNAD
jgi:hypothetical protein